MIEIVKKKKRRRETKPYYLLTYDYMIGDANGNTCETVNVSKDNPYLERYYTLLNSLQATKGTWGIVFDEHDFYKFFNEKQITEDDYVFLMRMMFPEYEDEGEIESNFDVPKENEDYSYEFQRGVKGDVEYSFLVFEGLDLHYIDSYGIKNKTKIIKK